LTMVPLKTNKEAEEEKTAQTINSHSEFVAPPKVSGGRKDDTKIPRLSPGGSDNR